MRILIIEDDATIAANLYDYFEAHGHSIDAAGDGVTGLHLAVSQTFDVIVLDLGLPGMDGLSLARKLREEAHIETPILMLTARDTLDDKLEGFSRGADDYLVKPFSLKEVEARLTAMHRRSSGRVTPRLLEYGQLTLDPKTMAVTFAGNEVKLPPKCLRILELLMRERHALLKVAGIAAGLIAELDSHELPIPSVEAADLLATSINELSEETLQDALSAVHAEIVK